MTVRRGRRSKQLLDGLKEKRGYWNLKEESLDRTLWRTGFVKRLRTSRKTAEWCRVFYVTKCYTGCLQKGLRPQLLDSSLDCGLSGLR